MIDLHIHSICSDGVLTSIQILERAVANGVKYLSIADHDSIGAYTQDFFQHAEDLGIKIIVGVEMSTKINGIGVHMLGYAFDKENVELINILDKLRHARKDYLIKVCKVLESLGFYVNIMELLKVPSVTKAHISLSIINDIRNREKLIRDFGCIPTKGKFIETLMNRGCPAYVDKFNITPLEASEFIHNAGGKVILAHPVCYKYEKNLNLSEVLEIAKTAKVDGIEANYLYIDRDNNLINEVNYWENVATENNWIITMGSDYHLSDNVHPEIGFANYKEKLGNIDNNNIITNLQKNN